MTKQNTVSNPDRNQVYHCWHYCRGCGKTWTHSQADWEDIKRHIASNHKNDWSLIATAPTDYLIAEVTINDKELRG